MKLLAFRTGLQEEAAVIQSAPARRPWMDATPNRYAYRCLPMTIANQYGWQLLCTRSFEALWIGGNDRDAVKIIPYGRGRGQLPSCHFGCGLITFHPGWLFRTERPFDLFVCGPTNGRKDGIVPLCGIVETTWLPFTFTMNWAFTRAGVPIRFEEGEPFCQIFPVQHALLDLVEPECREIESEPALQTTYREWAISRDAFNKDLRDTSTEAAAEGWQRFYTRGTPPWWPAETDGHQTRLTLREFANVEQLSVRGLPAQDAPPTDAPSSEAAGTVNETPVPCAHRGGQG
jgi:hypothetical protein